MEFRLRKIPDDVWLDIKASAREAHMFPNSYILELLRKEALRWRAAENIRIIRLADELKQRKLL